MNTANNAENVSETCPLCARLRVFSTKTALAALVIAYLLILLVLFPAIGGAGEIVPLDLRFWYTPAIVYSTFDALGAEGRDLYKIGATTVDVLYPLVYSTLLAVLLTRLVDEDTRRTCALRLLPFAVLGTDLLENGSIFFMLMRYPERLESLARASSIFTSIKWSLALIVVGAVLLLTIRAGWRRFRRDAN